MLEIGGRPSKFMIPGGLTFAGAMGKPIEEQIPSPERTYANTAPFDAMDAKERLTLMDREELERAVLYPTIALLWEAEVEDVELAAAYARAYNRWICDFCRDSNGRRGQVLLGLGLPTFRSSGELHGGVARAGGAHVGLDPPESYR